MCWILWVEWSLTVVDVLTSLKRLTVEEIDEDGSGMPDDTTDDDRD